ncbi:hypothetical protein RB195_009923 [Necator americanus]|uniref:Uncharacterized protein n=1 Tax=Necator americanus TaxID=51031 RepID=A0ABR1CWQ4_NECAM
MNAYGKGRGQYEIQTYKNIQYKLLFDAGNSKTPEIPRTKRKSSDAVFQDKCVSSNAAKRTRKPVTCLLKCCQRQNHDRKSEVHPVTYDNRSEPYHNYSTPSSLEHVRTKQSKGRVCAKSVPDGCPRSAAAELAVSMLLREPRVLKSDYETNETPTSTSTASSNPSFVPHHIHFILLHLCNPIAAYKVMQLHQVPGRLVHSFYTCSDLLDLIDGLMSSPDAITRIFAGGNSSLFHILQNLTSRLNCLSTPSVLRSSFIISVQNFRCRLGGFLQLEHDKLQNSLNKAICRSRQYMTKEAKTIYFSRFRRRCKMSISSTCHSPVYHINPCVKVFIVAYTRPKVAK